MKILFFGSTSDSTIVLENISHLTLGQTLLAIAAVVTQPPKPVGRKQIITPTPVQAWAQDHKIPFLSFPSNNDHPWLYESEQTVIDTLEPFKADLILSASYGQKIPSETVSHARFGGLNVHPSILPRWRGADPVPWAILAGDHQIGVSVVTLADSFDNGKIIGQKKIPMDDKQTADPIRTELFQLGADLIAELLSDYLEGKLKGSVQDAKTAVYAPKFTREDGYVSWEFLTAILRQLKPPEASIPQIFQKLNITDYPEALVRAQRALTPWPGLWTKITLHNEEKRLKLLKLSTSGHKLILEVVQLEGKNPVSYEQFAKAYGV